jgi:hypothetical protein
MEVLEPLIRKWVPVYSAFVELTEELCEVLCRIFATEAAFLNNRVSITAAIISGLNEDDKKVIHEGDIALTKMVCDRTSDDLQKIKHKQTVEKKVNRIFIKLRNEAYGYGDKNDIIIAFYKLVVQKI